MLKMMFSYFCLRLNLPLLPQRGAAALLLPHMWGNNHAAEPMHFSLNLTCCRGRHPAHPCHQCSNLGPAGQARCINYLTLISEQAVQWPTVVLQQKDFCMSSPITGSLRVPVIGLQSRNTTTRFVFSGASSSHQLRFHYKCAQDLVNI